MSIRFEKFKDRCERLFNDDSDEIEKKHILCHDIGST